jgi:hypothetical protein
MVKGQTHRAGVLGIHWAAVACAWMLDHCGWGGLWFKQQVKSRERACTVILNPQWCFFG